MSKKVRVNIVIIAGKVKRRKVTYGVPTTPCLGTNPRSEEQKQGSEGLSNGPKIRPTLHSSAMVVSRMVGC